ncbi:hypothetical protein SISSUDRAFT_1065440 [Sistotremastrum suecicum HHB10207 ss-3]|uniref:Uncharacterized protein n=1 Tax=Sistotremastrum suecicum HHB10207 ss-3 TaxID=1314776 RepID=A0A165ZG46_9AGAM|nr:hypothetical protein SISSUDRAFT_1065440 [Sistotremastrum suecicum HHB10207 ss-3]
MSELSGIFEYQPLPPNHSIYARFNIGSLSFEYTGSISSHSGNNIPLSSQYATVYFNNFGELIGQSTFQGTIGTIDRLTVEIKLSSGVLIRALLSSTYFPAAEIGGVGSWRLIQSSGTSIHSQAPED